MLTVELNKQELAELSAYAEQQGRPVEEVAADLLAAAIVRVKVVTGE